MNVRELHPHRSDVLSISIDTIDHKSNPADEPTLYSAKLSASISTAGTSTSCVSSEKSLEDAGSKNIPNSKQTTTIKASELRKSKEVDQSTFHYESKSDDSTNEALDFDSKKGLVGCWEKETAQLKACLNRMLSQPRDDQLADKASDSFASRKELVYVSGLSGCGKARVARSIADDVRSRHNGIFVEGKFDMNASNEPYSGVARCFGELCQKIMASEPDLICEVQVGIREQLGKEADVLVRLVPELQYLVSNTLPNAGKINIGADDIDNKLERLRFAFRGLTKVFSSCCSPLVLFFDNLQWADVSSVQMLDFLISDTQNDNSLMIIGCYRSEEVNDDSLLRSKIVSLREKTETFGFHMTEISIEPFGEDEIAKVIQNIMPNSIKPQITELAALCHRRTHGNPYFVVEFLKMLHQEGLLQYKTSSDIWTWDLHEIETATMSTANVYTMLQDRLRKLPEQEQTILQCAAYLGSSFSDAMIDIVWTTYGRRLIEQRIKPTTLLLEGIVEEDILEKVSTNQYRWVHENLQEAALQFTGQRRESFQLDIGRTLYYGLEKEQVEEELFSIVDLINNGNALKLPEFANANLRAAQKARKLSAFESARIYAAHGASLLTENKWVTNRSLTLGLYIMGAEMELMMGNVSEASRYSSEVLSQPGLSIMDTVQMKIARANTLGSVELKYRESVNCYIKILGELGHRVTRSRRLVPVQALVRMMRTIKRAKSKPQSFYDTMVAVEEDPKQMAITSVLSKMLYPTMMSGDILLFLLCVCKLVDMTLDYGINESSALCFASLGHGIAIAQNDHKTAMIFIDIALSMLKKFQGMHAADTICLAHMTLSCVQPIEACIPMMRNSVAEGMRSGDTESAIWNAFFSIIAYPYGLGKPLTSVLKECSKMFAQCEDAAQVAHVGATRIFWQMLHNLCNSSSSTPAELEGDIFSVASLDKDNIIHVAFGLFAKGELSLFFSDYLTMAKQALENGDKFAKMMPLHPLIMIETFHRAVALYAAAFQTKKRKYRVEARRLAKKIAKWAENGNPNVTYYHLFLEAEQLALDKKYEKAEAKYEEALKVVTTEGHLHHLGLLNERYADFLMERCSNTEKYMDRLKDATRYYKEWGADRKVKILESRQLE